MMRLKGSIYCNALKETKSKKSHTDGKRSKGNMVITGLQKHLPTTNLFFQRSKEP